MDRLEQIRGVVDDILRQSPEQHEGRCGFVHLYGVAVICSLLALKRGSDPLVCATAGMLHDISSYKTGDPANHARLSALEAGTVLRASDRFSDDEISAICFAIANHSSKDDTHDELSELLKDADVLHHYLYNTCLKAGGPVSPRLAKVLRELDIPESQESRRSGGLP